MTTNQIEPTEFSEDRNALLENTLMETYLHEKGYSLEKIKDLPHDLAEKLMKEASQYASLKMEEVQARAHFINDLHEDTSSLEK